MDCTLMHRDVAVAEFSLDEASGIIVKLNAVVCPKHLPVGVEFRNGTVDRSALNAWWVNRSIPASRSGVQQALETLGIESTQALVARSAGLSLSDQYWIRPRESDLQWSAINFFDHDFSEDIGNLLLGKVLDSKNVSFHSPDLTSDGFLAKRWKIINGKRCLLKGGSSPFRQQPFNEVIASRLAERLNIPCVKYTSCGMEIVRTACAKTSSRRIRSLSVLRPLCKRERGETAYPFTGTIRTAVPLFQTQRGRSTR